MEAKPNHSTLDLQNLKGEHEYASDQLAALKKEHEIEQLPRVNQEISEAPKRPPPPKPSAPREPIRDDLGAKPQPARKVATDEEIREWLKRTPMTVAPEKRGLELARESLEDVVDGKSVPARFYSKTGVEMEGRVVKVHSANGEIGPDTKVTVVVKDSYREVTREATVKDLAFGAEKKPIRESADYLEKRSPKDMAQSLADHANYNLDHLNDLNRAKQAAHDHGDVRAIGKVGVEIHEFHKVDTALYPVEMRTIDLTKDAYTGENLVRRYPADVTKTGRVQLRPGEYTSDVRMTDAERSDLKKVEAIKDSRRGAARNAEDKPYFEAAGKLTEDKILRGRLSDKKQEVAKDIQKFTGGNSFTIPRYPEYAKYNYGNLVQALGPEAESRVMKESLKKVRELVDKPSRVLLPSETRELQDALHRLRSPRVDAIIEKNPTLKSFFDYAAHRAGYSELDEMAGRVKH